MILAGERRVKLRFHVDIDRVLILDFGVDGRSTLEVEEAEREFKEKVFEGAGGQISDGEGESSLVVDSLVVLSLSRLIEF